MKNNLTASIRMLIFCTGIMVSLVSCEYQDIADADYPEQLIYMPASRNGVYTINTVALPIGNTTPGNASRYKVDLSAKEFIVPLAVYRSGINNDGTFKVDISVNNDTVNDLLAIPGKLPNGTILLAPDKYSIVSSVDLLNGNVIAPFDLVIKLDSMLNNYPNKIYAFGVTVSSTERKSNPKYATTIVVIDTKMMKPTSDFSFAADGSDPKKITFNNKSLMSVGYSWNFGDGTPADITKSPSHIYSTAGTYTVTLTAIGITGDLFKSTFTASVTVQ